MTYCFHQLPDKKNVTVFQNRPADEFWNLRASRLVSVLVTFLFCSFFSTAQQEYELKFLKKISNTTELQHLYDSLLIPLLVDNSKVYLVNTECFSRNDGGNSNNRNSGGNSNERNSGGNSNERASGGNSNDRNTGGNSNDRMSGGNSNERESGGYSNERNSGGNSNERNTAGNSNERSSGGNSNERNTAGFIAYLSCGTDGDGKLIIYMHNRKPDKNLKIFYNHNLYGTDSHFFKLKKT